MKNPIWLVILIVVGLWFVFCNLVNISPLYGLFDMISHVISGTVSLGFLALVAIATWFNKDEEQKSKP